MPTLNQEKAILIRDKSDDSNEKEVNYVMGVSDWEKTPKKEGDILWAKRYFINEAIGFARKYGHN